MQGSIVIALLLAACGGRDESGELTGAPLPGGGEALSSKEICAMTMADFDDVGPAPMSPDIAAVACADHRFARRAENGDVQLRNFEALRALAPLPDVETTIDAVVDVLTRAVALRHESVAAARASDAGALRELEARLAGVEGEFRDPGERRGTSRLRLIRRGGTTTGRASPDARTSAS